MPKLIIPNALELYRQPGFAITGQDAVARQFYQARFLWLLEKGDAIILPEEPAAGFREYLANLKQFDQDSVSILPWTCESDQEIGKALCEPVLLEQLKRIITQPSIWNIEACYFNIAILQLADSLNIKIDPAWRRLVLEDAIRRFNSKQEFRTIAQAYNLPIPAGTISSTASDLSQAILNLLPATGQVIIKQDFNGGGRGNIGVTTHSVAKFAGVQKVIHIRNSSANAIAHEAADIWNDLTGPLNDKLIVETYYPNQGTFTAVLLVGKEDEAAVVSYSEIRMEATWIGVEFPASALASAQIQDLIYNARIFGEALKARGYHGYLCCDAILTSENKLLFTELNVRPGAETNAYEVARQIHGPDYLKNSTTLTRRGLPMASSFLQTRDLLSRKGLLVSGQRREGVVILTIDDRVSRQAEYLVTARSLPDALAIENELLLALEPQTLLQVWPPEAQLLEGTSSIAQDHTLN